MGGDNAEIRILGSCASHSLPFAAGKIYMCGSEPLWCEHASGAPIICFSEYTDVQSIAYHISVSPPSGIIIPPEAVSDNLLELLRLYRIPCLVTPKLTPLPPELFGHIALIDTQRDMLIIDPELDTLNVYSSTLRQSLTPKEESGIFRKYGIQTFYSGKESGGSEGILLSAPSALGGSEYTDILMQTAEASLGERITALLSVPKTEREAELFCEYAEAVFCASVYGNFSLLFGGFSAEEDISRSLSLFSKTFRRLREEGREFNGYLKKGLFIDSPIWLFRPLPMRTPDTVCIDADMLTSRILGTSMWANNDENALLTLLKYAPCPHLQGAILTALAPRLCKSTEFGQIKAMLGINHVYTAISG